MLLSRFATRHPSGGPARARRRGQPLDNANLNGLATSADGTMIYVTFTGPGQNQGGVLELPAFVD
jgi:hypothetical protein